MRYLSTLVTSFVALLTLAQASVARAADTYSFDKEHTAILFYINHLGFSDKIGFFTDYDGYFVFNKDHPEQSKVEVSLKPSGIKTGSSALDQELQSKGWFNVAQFPEIKFKSTQVKVTGENKADITGWVSMLGKDEAVVMHVTFNKEGEHPITKNHVAGFSADAEIVRSHFGLINGIPFVGDNVRLHIETEGVRKTTSIEKPADKKPADKN